MTNASVTVQYSPEQTATILSMYAGKESVDAIATAVGKSVRSVVAKLSREGVYVAKSKATKAKGATKAELVAGIAAKLNASVEVVESLEKATKEALLIVFDNLPGVSEL